MCRLEAFTCAGRAAALLCLLPAIVVQAQSVTPGQIADTLKKPPELAAPAEPQTEIQRAPAAFAGDASADAHRIMVRSFSFNGNVLFSDHHLQQQLADLIGKPVSMLDLYEAADRIAALYVQQGYTLASVNLPPQKVSDGAILLQVSEGRVARVEIANAKRYRTEHVHRYLGSFRSGQIYRADSLQEGLRRLSTLPGLSVKATVRPGTEAGSSDIVLALDETFLQGSVSLDNHGRESVGELRLNAAAVLNNPLRIEDQLQIVGLVSEDELTRYGAFNYSRPVNFRGTRLRLGYGHAEFKVDNSTVEGRSRSGEIMIEHPFVHDARQRLLVSTGVARTLSNADFSGLIFNQTSITLLRLGLAYTRTHANNSVTQLSSSVSSNFDSLSIEDFAGGEVDGNQRFKWDLDVQHLLPLTSSLQLYLRAAGAWSPDPLVDTEKYSLGGPGSVRGFPSAEVRGDHGYFGNVTLQHLAPMSLASLRSRIFVDAGEVFSVDAPDAGSLASVGLGFDLIGNPLSLRLDWAYPLGNRDISDGRDSGRLFGTLAASF
jgi:hemolysin activation/secretion protein